MNTTQLVSECPNAVFEPYYDWSYVYVVSVVSSLVILTTIVGNVFVIAAIVLEKNLHRISNYLIISLAIADMMVAVVVMPISTISTFSKGWWMGIQVCDFFIVMDVCCCTSSIMHLVAIAVDRYWAITRIDYIRLRRKWPIISMGVLVWAITICLAVPSRFAPNREEIVSEICQGICRVNQSTIYTVFSVGIAFYLPMLILVIIYAQIYKAARSRIRKKNFKSVVLPSNSDSNKNPEPTTSITQMPSYNDIDQVLNDSLEDRISRPSNSLANEQQLPPPVLNNSVKFDESSYSLDETLSYSPWVSKTCEEEHYFDPNNSLKDYYLSRVLTDSMTTCFYVDKLRWKGMAVASFKYNRKKKKNELFKSAATVKDSLNTLDLKQRIEQRREKKAARTLAIITGCFVGCWLPYSLYILIVTFCEACSGDRLIFDSLNWLGYFNSLLNPIIYTIFSPDFRNAFKKIIYHRSLGKSG